MVGMEDVVRIAQEMIDTYGDDAGQLAHRQVECFIEREDPFNSAVWYAVKDTITLLQRCKPANDNRYMCLV